MVYTVIINGQSYDLPKKTMKVVDEMDKVSRVDDDKKLNIRDKYKKLCAFITSLVGLDNVKEILGSDNLDEVDLSDVTLTFRKIMDAYDKPIDDYNEEKNRAILESIPVDKIVELARVAKDMPHKK